MDHDPIVQLMSQNPPKNIMAATLLIQELMKAGEDGTLANSCDTRKDLIQVLITDPNVPEEYAQRLLRLKLANHLNQKQYRLILNEYGRLNNPEDPLNRLVCNTSEYYKLVSIFAQALIAVHQYKIAYEFIQDIREKHFDETYFKDLPDSRLLITEILTKQALAAHFSPKYSEEAYPLFKSIPMFSQTPSHAYINAFVVFGYECRECQKYEEASDIFHNLYVLMQSKEYKTESDLELFREITAMYIITSILALKKVDTEIRARFDSLFLNTEEHPLSQINTTLKAQVERFSSNKEEEAAEPFNPFFGPLFEALADENTSFPAKTGSSAETRHQKNDSGIKNKPVTRPFGRK